MDPINEIIQLYKKYGNSDYIGEPISQSEHAIQAGLNAQQDKQSDDVIVSALLHDIGHLCGLRDNDEHKLEVEIDGDLGVHDHEKYGSLYLKKLGFSDVVCDLVENHVSAKRYLVSKNSDYYDSLSDASKQTLIYQGGKMSEEEMEVYEKLPNFQSYIKLRHYDDISKKQNMKLPSMDHFIENMKKCIKN